MGWISIYANNRHSDVPQAMAGQSQLGCGEHLGRGMEQLPSQIPSTTSVRPGLCLPQTGDSLFRRHL